MVVAATLRFLDGGMLRFGGVCIDTYAVGLQGRFTSNGAVLKL